VKPRNAYNNLLVFFIFKFALMYILRMMLKHYVKSHKTEIEAMLLKTQNPT